MILIESLFYETDRKGHRLQKVYLAITSYGFIIAKECDIRSSTILKTTTYDVDIKNVYPLQFITLLVFKHTSRQTLKAILGDGSTRYFELGYFNNRNVLWQLWCKYIRDQLNGNIWPGSSRSSRGCISPSECFCCDIIDFNRIPELEPANKRSRWTNKHLYLGNIRSEEEKERPKPIPGLGDDEQTKMLYLKSKTFEAEKNINNENLWDDHKEVYTYMGEPTSNIPYTSILYTDY